jgi:hypothetical protein
MELYTYDVEALSRRCYKAKRQEMPASRVLIPQLPEKRYVLAACCEGVDREDA